MEVDGVEYPADYSNPNPNGELDNLYLDMNGIVHPCTHPEGRPAPENEDEMMAEVFRYTDNVLQMARPRKILMIAVDGVAPRAKMNQQRARRFRAAQDAKIEADNKERAMAEAESRGEQIDEAIKGKRKWDSNVITPGTPFMSILAKSLRYWIAYKLNNDPGWKNLKVVISDATVPGEGEHKIMEFIRSQRGDPSYDPNTSHCIYGLDADLIFLGLATHEPHFSILREDVFASGKPSRAQTNYGITSGDQKRLEQEAQVEKAAPKPFIWLHIDILRQYLEIELSVPDVTFPFNLERAIDDWVFMCFFVGNDFLPHLPSLDVRDHSIDRLTSIWKRSLNSMKGYMTCDGNVKLDRVEHVLKRLGGMESDIFRAQQQQKNEREARDKRFKTEQQSYRQTEQQSYRQIEDAAISIQGQNTAPAAPAVSKNRGERAPIQPLDNMPLYSPSGESVGSVHMSNSDIVKNRNAITMANMANKSVAEQLKARLLAGESPDITSDETPDDTPIETPQDMGIEAVHEPEETKIKKRKAETVEDIDRDAEDPIQLGAPGYGDRYYAAKLHVPMSEVPEVKKEVVRKYVEGVCWVLLYYYQGCASWNWYYPYHYAPFAQDFVNIGQLDIAFDKGEPFRPYEQLMSVLPIASNHTLPKVFRPLMSDPDSSIVDFYPVDFPIDMNGKKNAWQGIAILPFIDESRLLPAVRSKYDELTADETFRNTNQKEYLMIGPHNVMYERCCKTLYGNGDQAQVNFRAADTQGIAGVVMKDENCIPGSVFTCPINTSEWNDIENDQTLSLRYDMPELTIRNKSMLRPGVQVIPLVLSQSEEMAIRENHRGKPTWKNIQTPPKKAEPANDRAPGMRGGYMNFVAMSNLPDGGRSRPGRNYDHEDGNGYNSRYNGGYNGGYRGGRGGYGGNQGGGYGRGGYGGGYNNNQSQGGRYQGGGGGYQGNQGRYQGQNYQGNYQGHNYQGGNYQGQNYQGQGGQYRTSGRGGYQGGQGQRNQNHYNNNNSSNSGGGFNNPYSGRS